MTIDSTELQHRLDFALAAAGDAGALILKYYQQPKLAVDLKDDQSPVTAADRGAEELLRDRINREFPDDGILGEEFGEQRGANEFRWILDPVDGTKSFIHGVPLFGTLIGLEHQEQVVLGVCRFPALSEVVYAALGLGTWWRVGSAEPRKTNVTSVADLSDALLCFTEVEGWHKINRLETFDRLCRAARITRGWSDCYGHMLVATGRADVMVDPLLNPWDAAALLPIVQEAGGCFVDWKGRPSIHSGNGISVNRALKEQVLSILAAGEEKT